MVRDTIRVLVVDDEGLMRGLLGGYLFRDAEDVTVVGLAHNGREAIRLCRERQPDIVVLDYVLPDIQGDEVIRRVKGITPWARIVVLTGRDLAEYAARAIEAGADGYVLKTTAPSQLLEVVRSVHDGETWVDPKIGVTVARRYRDSLDDAPESTLSNRELDVVTRVARGQEAAGIATELGLSPWTVYTYLKRARKKLGLKNNAELTRFAIRRGLVDADHPAS